MCGSIADVFEKVNLLFSSPTPIPTLILPESDCLWFIFDCSYLLTVMEQLEQQQQMCYPYPHPYPYPIKNLTSSFPLIDLSRNKQPVQQTDVTLMCVHGPWVTLCLLVAVL